MARIRLGTCSPAAGSTPQASLALVGVFARRAAARGVDLLLLPEAFLGSGYPRGETFGCAVGARLPAGRDAFLDYFRRAVDFGDIVGDAGVGGGAAWVQRKLGEVEKSQSSTNGSTAADPPLPGDGTRETLERIARDTGVFLVVGAVERTGGSLYCSVVYVCPRRGMIAKRRKVQPTGSERLIWAAAGPASLRAVSAEIKGVRINLAAAICWENYMPLVRQALYAQNVNLYLAPTADARDAWLGLLRTIGVEGRCFVVSSNMCTSRPSAAAEAVAAKAAGPSSTQQADRPTTATGPAEAPTAANEPGTTSSEVITKIIKHVDADGVLRERKKSFVLDEYGNEIVLSCQLLDKAGVSKDTNPAAEACAPPPLAPVRGPPADEAWERRKRERRRSSIFDADDNEIVVYDPIEEEAVTDGEGDQNGHDGSHEKTGKQRTAERVAAPDAVPRAAPKPVVVPVAAPVATPVAAAAQPLAAPSPFPTISRGGSAIVSPFGDVLAGPQWDDPDGIETADVDFDDCIRGRLDLDVGGSYSRNDSFKFSVEGLDLSPLPYY